MVKELLLKTRFKDWQNGSSDRALAQQAGGSEFNPQYC
jgi:hypothetical protein